MSDPVASWPRLTPYELGVLRQVYAGPGSRASYRQLAAARPRWQTPSARGAILANTRRAVAYLKSVGLVVELVRPDDGGDGVVALTTAGADYLGRPNLSA